MCGFLAEFNLNLNVRNEASPNIKSAAESLILRRGPDGLHKIRAHNFEVSFARLSITDIAHGVQPFYTSNGFLAFGNGEIYNAEEIFKRIELPPGMQDTIGSHDIKIAAEFLSKNPRVNWEKLEGMFSLVLYGPEGEVFFGRDRVGEKPAFYSYSGNKLVVGSSVESVAKQLETSLFLDEKQLNNWLLYGGVDVGNSLFSEIKEVYPGAVCVFNSNKKEQFHYWHWPRRGNDTQIPENYAEQIIELAEQCRSSNFAGCLLWSGGLDSTVLRQSLSTNGFVPESIHISFRETTFNEDIPTTLTASSHSNLHSVVFEDWISKSNIDSAIELMDQPISDPACLPLLTACAKAKEHQFRVVYTGDGGDEVFRGYEAIRHESSLKSLMLLMQLIPKRLLNMLFFIISRKRDRKYISYLSIALRVLAAAIAPKGKGERILVSPNYTISVTFPELFDDSNEFKFLNYERYFQTFVLPQIYLQKTDRIASGLGIEARSPWLSKSFIEIGMTFSKEFLEDVGKPFKIILPKGLRLRKQKKHGLGVPLNDIIVSLDKPVWIIPNLSLRKLDEIWLNAIKGSAGSQGAAWSLYVLNEKLRSWKSMGLII